jgi:leader peptidase (prepilin peptidase) / N-methyltransferase
MRETQSEDESIWPRGAMLAGVAALSLALSAGLLPVVSAWEAAFSGYLFCTMALITWIDRRHFIVPDVLSLPAVAIGLLASTIIAPAGNWYSGMTEGLAGAVIGGGTLFLLRAAYFRLRGIEGLGLGDVKLAAAAGAWLGPAALAPACLVAALAGLLSVMVQAAVGGREALNARSPVPFGSFIAPVIFAFWMIRILEDVPFWWEDLLMR